MIYAESSAVLAWLLGDERGGEVKSLLSGADDVIASELTFVECERILIRAVATEEAAEAQAAGRKATLNRAVAHWTRLGLSQEILTRATLPFPIEPVRTLDAIHLATALAVRSAGPELRLLSLDRRIRENGEQLGFEVVP